MLGNSFWHLMNERSKKVNIERLDIALLHSYTRTVMKGQDWLHLEFLRVYEWSKSKVSLIKSSTNKITRAKALKKRFFIVGINVKEQDGWHFLPAFSFIEIECMSGLNQKPHL